MKVLQIGQENWLSYLTLQEEDVWYHTQGDQLSLFLDQLQKEQAKDFPESQANSGPLLRFDAVLLTSRVSEWQLDGLAEMVEAYRVFQDSPLSLHSEEKTGFFRRKMLQTLPAMDTYAEKWQFLKQTLFSGQYGAKLKIPAMDPNPQFLGEIQYEGHVAVRFEGEFGQDFQPLFTYRYNLSSFDIALELWQEYTKEGKISVQLELTGIKRGSLYDLSSRLVLEEEELTEPYILEPNDEVSFYIVTLSAKGRGSIRFGSLHWRYSRMGLGQLLPGGKRHSDSKRQEVMTYFNPGDMKPPLAIYFSGYRGAEGFEGFEMMKRMGTPFMLIADPRIEGGSFYIGTNELETKLRLAIQEALDYLGFAASETIFSGMSMGSYGAMYYAASFCPYAVIVGKPFTDLGETAKGMKLKRPDEFETIGDLLHNIVGGTDQQDLTAVNQRFWSQFGQADFSGTTFAIAYMEQDDYEGGAIHRLLPYLYEKQAHVYSKGYEGRHNDRSPAINKWFKTQYRRLLKKGYQRK